MPLCRHLLGVAAAALAALLEVHLEELGAKRLGLLLHRGAHVEEADHRAHVLSRLYGGQAGDATAQHEDLGGGHLVRVRVKVRIRVKARASGQG